MLTGSDIVCLSSLRWQSFPTSRHHLARILSESNRVLYVDPPGSLGRVPPSRSTLSREGGLIRLAPPPHLPYGGPLRMLLTSSLNQEIYARAVRGAMKSQSFVDPIVWNVFPVYSAASLSDRPRSRLEFLHMTDSLWDYPWFGPRYEDALRRCLERAAFTIGSSPAIVERLSHYGRPAYLLGHGVDVDLFAPVASGDQPVHPAIENRRRPRIGFMGSVDHRLDVELIVRLAAIGSVTLIGPVASGPTGLERHELSQLAEAGCFIEGLRSSTELPSWLAGVDVAVVPYRSNSLVRASNPLKLLDYLAAGLPVVALDIPATRCFEPHLTVAADRVAFVEEVRRLAALEPDPGLRRSRHAVAAEQSWRRRAEELSDLICANRPS